MSHSSLLIPVPWGASAQALDLAASTDAPDALDVIFIEGYAGHTVIGIHDSELVHPQPLVIDIHAGLPRARACSTDAIGDTIDYSVVRDRLDALMQHHGVRLLEALAERLAAMLLDDFRAVWVRVRVVKPCKFDNVQRVGVQIERRAATRPSSAADGVGRSAQILDWIGSGMVPRRE